MKHLFRINGGFTHFWYYGFYPHWGISPRCSSGATMGGRKESEIIGMQGEFSSETAVFRDLELTDIPSFMLRFRSDLPFLIEQNRRRSRATLRILRLKERQRWPEDEM